MIKLGLGTRNLKEKFNNDYYNLFEYSVENQFKIIEKITDETKNEILNLQTSYSCENIY